MTTHHVLSTGTGQPADVPLLDYITSNDSLLHLPGAGNHPSKTLPPGGGGKPPLHPQPGPGSGLVAVSSSNTSTAKGPQNKDAANRFQSLRSVHMAVSPEISLMAAR